MLLYSLDTNVCVRILRNRPFLIGPLADRLNEAADSIAASTVVAMELLHGAAISDRPEQRREQVKRLLARMTVLDFDAEAAEHAAEIKANLKRRGELIGSNDVLIAGHARSRGLILVTGNLREFERVEGLRVEDWPAGPHASAIK